MTRLPNTDLGFTGLLAEGLTPAEAWQVIHDELLAEPGAVAIILDMERTEQGRRALAWSRAQWAEHGLTAPWDHTS